MEKRFLRRMESHAALLRFRRGGRGREEERSTGTIDWRVGILGLTAAQYVDLLEVEANFRREEQLQKRRYRSCAPRVAADRAAQ